MKKKNMAGLSESEKIKLKKSLIWDLAKKFVNNLTTYLEIDEENWTYLDEKTSLTGKTLKLTFKLSDSAIEQEVVKLDVEQKKLDDFNPDDELQVIH